MHRDQRTLPRRALVPIVTLAGLLALASPAVVVADATLVGSVPSADQVLTELPTEVVLTFNEPLTENSSFAVLDAAGTTVASGAWDAANPTMIRGALPAVAPGIYEVQWVAASADGHLPRGTFSFTVVAPTPAPATPTPVPSDEPTAEPTPTQAPTPTPSPTPDPGTTGGGGLDVVLPIAIVALVLGLGLAMLLRRRPA